MRSPGLVALTLVLVACGDDTAATRDTHTLDTSDAATSDTVDDTATSDAVDDAATSDTIGDAATSDTADTAATDTVGDTATPDTVDDDATPDTSLDTSPAPVWDLTMIRDASTAACTFTDARQVLDDGVLLDVWNLSYVSWESIDGALQPITIRAFAARPAAASGKLPGVVQAHGLGGAAEERHATGLAALLGTFVVAYTGPGGGTTADNTSQGRASGYDDGRRMFDTLPDPRGSWFWGHAVAAMRALTCLEHHPDVDPTRLGMTGFSAGAVATLTVAGVDDRLVAAVPLSGTLAWDVATRSPSAWQHGLLTLAGLDTQSPAWAALMTLLDPAALLGGSDVAVLMVNGTTDEFFPVSAHVATYDAIGGDKRTAFAANSDHGCYGLSGVESAAAIEARADLRARGGQRAWFGHHFGSDARFATLPDAPTLDVTAVGAALLAVAHVDEDAGGLEVAEVKLWWSGDDAFVWGSNTLERQAPDTWGALVPLTLTPALITYVDVEYTTGELLGATRFALSSRPELPAGHVPRIRQMTTCLPP